jgi:hypothetical protein
VTSQLALIDVQSVFLFTIIVLGYIACFALWWFVFRGRGDE